MERFPVRSRSVGRLSDILSSDADVGTQSSGWTRGSRLAVHTALLGDVFHLLSRCDKRQFFEGADRLFYNDLVLFGSVQVYFVSVGANQPLSRIRVYKEILADIVCNAKRHTGRARPGVRRARVWTWMRRRFARPGACLAFPGCRPKILPNGGLRCHDAWLGPVRS